MQYYSLIIIIVITNTCSFSQSNFGSILDSRDGKRYKTVKIDNKWWMAENINYETGTSWCYDNNPRNCEIYGRLYDWNTAKDVCPPGWRLPSNREWCDLVKCNYYEYLHHNCKCPKGSRGRHPCYEGKKLKSKSGWYTYRDGSLFYNYNGSDEYGFNALPGGVLISPKRYWIDEEEFKWLGKRAYFWTSDIGSSNGYRWSYIIKLKCPSVEASASKDNYGISVRCLKD